MAGLDLACALGLDARRALVVCHDSAQQHRSSAALGPRASRLALLWSLTMTCSVCPCAD